MSAAAPLHELVADAEAAGVVLRLAGDGRSLDVEGPAPVLSPAMLERLERHRNDLLRMLGGEPVDAAPDADEALAEAAHAFIERLGIADELGMPTGMGSPAWLNAARAAVEAADRAAP